MENLFIEEKRDTFFVPGVNFNAETGICELAGESYLEDAFSFYKDLYQWLDTFTKEVNNPLVFNFRLTYFNTSSSKGILDIMNKLKEYEQKGGDVTVNWYYPEDDIDNLEEAEDYIADTNLDINLISY